MIQYNHEKHPYILSFGTKNWTLFIYKSEFVITVIVITEFDCMSLKFSKAVSVLWSHTFL